MRACLNVEATAAIAAVSYLVVPSWWSDWVAMLRSDTGLTAGTSVPVPLWIRIPLAIAVVALGARTDRRWSVPVAAFLALPTIWPQGFAVLVGAVPLVRVAARRPSTPHPQSGLEKASTTDP